MHNTISKTALIGWTVFAAIALLIATTATARADRLPDQCTDGYQVGATAYGRFGTENVLSVKQYWSPSCRKNWGYAWVWDSVRKNVTVTHVQLELDNGDTLAESLSRNQEVLSGLPKISTSGRCTRVRATVEIQYSNGTKDAPPATYTQFRCG